MTQGYLPACLESLRRQPYPHLQVVVVDNASLDDSAAYVAQDSAHTIPGTAKWWVYDGDERHAWEHELSSQGHR